MTTRTRHVVITVIAIAALAAAPFCWRWLQIDDCLDRGAAWDHDRDACVTDYQPAPP